jgi:hypothetical protein
MVRLRTEAPALENSGSFALLETVTEQNISRSGDRLADLGFRDIVFFHENT